MSEEKTFVLKHPGGCTGMFWRGSPVDQARAPSKPDWPRNGSALRGNIHDLAGVAWLEALSYKQAGASADADWTPTPGCWMPFQQGGLVLHTPEE